MHRQLPSVSLGAGSCRRTHPTLTLTLTLTRGALRVAAVQDEFMLHQEFSFQEAGELLENHRRGTNDNPLATSVTFRHI